MTKPTPTPSFGMVSSKPGNRELNRRRAKIVRAQRKRLEQKQKGKP